MPINESSDRLRGDLTPEQERAMQAAAYGLPSNPTLTQMLANATPQELAQLRTLLGQGTIAPMREFDLNKPPRDLTLDPNDPAGQGPYQHQEFPRILYEHTARAWRLVQNRTQMLHFLSAGWRTDPYPNEAPPDEPELDAASQAEAAKIDAQLRKPKSPK